MAKNKTSSNTNIPTSGKTHRRGIIVAIIAVTLVLAVILSVGTALSWFSPLSVVGSKTYALVTDFSATMLHSFDGTAYTELNRNDNGNLAYDDISTSALSSLTLKVRYTGDSSAYLRVRMHDSFYDANGNMIPTSEIYYTVDSSIWELGEDGCYYTKEPISAYYDATDTADYPVTDGKYSANTVDINFATSVSCTYTGGSGYGNNIYVNLVPIIESVQPDRYDEFFVPETTAETTEI